MKPVVLFRKSLSEEGELEACSKYIKTVSSRMDIENGSYVIGRYSVLPYYGELEQDLSRVNSKLCNSYNQHRWIADIWEWASPYSLLEKFTPKTWDSLVNLPDNKQFILKGRTNSRKNLWNTHMFASDRSKVTDIAISLLQDPLICEQGIVVREFIPLKQLAVSISGAPVTNEWRTFWFVKEGVPYLLSKGFYWKKSFPSLSGEFTKNAETLVYKIAQAIAENEAATFFVLDIAQKQNSEDWILIEVNDGQMSGTCGCDEEELYSNLAKILG
jgi:hypothetical protein